MSISLERLFSGESSEILLNETYDFSAEPVQDAFPFIAPVKLTGKIEAKAQVVSLQAEAEVRYRSFCDRCAREAERVWHVPVCHILVEELQNEDDEGEYILAEERHLDLERLTLEDIYLFLPSKFLCRDVGRFYYALSMGKLFSDMFTHGDRFQGRSGAVDGLFLSSTFVQ